MQSVSVVLVSCRKSPAMLDSSGGDCRTPRRFSLRHKKWKYRGEGNANLVLALTQVGVIVRHFYGTVLQVCGTGWLITRSPCSTPFLLYRPLPLYTTLFPAPNFRFNAHWPAALCYANSWLFQYFWWEYRFWFTPTFSVTQLGRKTRAWCRPIPVIIIWVIVSYRKKVYIYNGRFGSFGYSVLGNHNGRLLLL